MTEGTESQEYIIFASQRIHSLQRPSTLKITSTVLNFMPSETTPAPKTSFSPKVTCLLVAQDIRESELFGLVSKGPTSLGIACRPIDEDLAEEIRQFRSPSDGETRMFYEIVIAPGYSDAGLTKLQGKSKTLRILEAKPRAPSGRSLRQIAGPPFDHVVSGNMQRLMKSSCCIPKT